MTAWELFRQLARTTIADIAEALGMSSANIYRFFASKNAMTEAICGNLLGGLLEARRAIANGPGAAAERIAAVLMTLHRNYRDQMTHEKRVHEVVAVAMEESWPPIDEFLQACAGLIGDLVAEGQAAGEFGPGDPMRLASGRWTPAPASSTRP